MESMADFEKEIDASFRVLRKGDTITGIIVDITEDGVAVDINYFAPGFIPSEQLSDDPGFRPMFDLKMGDEIKATVIEVEDAKGNVLLSRKEAVEDIAWETLNLYLENETLVSVKVQSAVNAGVVCYLEGIRGFIPASQLSLTYVDDLEAYVGKTLDAHVITVDKERGKLILSAKQILMQKEMQATKKKMDTLMPGMMLEGVVESMQPYGAFVTLENGLTGLVHISKICNKRIKKPSEVLKLNQKVKVKVLEIKDGKLSLSMKDFDEDQPIEEVDDTPAFEYKSDDDSGITAFGLLLDGLKLE